LKLEFPRGPTPQITQGFSFAVHASRRTKNTSPIENKQNYPDFLILRLVQNVPLLSRSIAPFKTFIDCLINATDRSKRSNRLMRHRRYFSLSAKIEKYFLENADLVGSAVRLDPCRKPVSRIQRSRMTTINSRTGSRE